MTGNDILRKSLVLLGYTDSCGSVENNQRILTRAVGVINQVYADLFYAMRREGFEPITAPSDEIKLPERILYDIMPYGVAAFLAQSESDGDNQQTFMSIYNSKRAALTHADSLADVIPVGE